MWKIKNFPHYHPFHKLYYRRGTAIFKKNSFFLFLRETKDGGRKTKDGERTDAHAKPATGNRQKTHTKYCTKGELSKLYKMTVLYKKKKTTRLRVVRKLRKHICHHIRHIRQRRRTGGRGRENPQPEKGRQRA